MTPADESAFLTWELEGASTGLTPGGIYDAVTSFMFMKSTAVRAAIPFAAHWHLVYASEKVWPWRVVDAGIPAAQGSAGRLVFTLQNPESGSQAPGRYLKAQMQAYGHAFRAITEIAAGNLPTDLTCTNRRDGEKRHAS